MNYLLDTNHWSYLQRNNTNVLTCIKNLPENDTIYMSVITQAELLIGVELVIAESRKQELRAFYNCIISEFTKIVYIDSKVAREFALIFVELRQKGKPIETNDIWLAAIPKAYDIVLVTNDEHFQYIGDLKIENWSSTIY